MAREPVAPLPVLVEDVAEAQVGDASAAQLAEHGQRRAVAADAEPHLEQVAATLERRAVVWCGQTYELRQLRSEGVAGRVCSVAGAARHQAAHAVTDEHDLL